MTKDKDLKRIVRSRMQKTGESYTTARAQLLQKQHPSDATPVLDPASLAGMSDEAVRASTGRTWTEWVNALDAIGAVKMPHREIAAHLHRVFDLPGWWAQTVTVGYERIRGLRDLGQRREGSYEVNKTKTYRVPVAKLYRAFSLARTRRRWLAEFEFTIRTARSEKTMRMVCPDGTAVDVSFHAKGDAKSSVTVQHRKLATKGDADRIRAFWTERLEALARLLE